MKRYRVVSDWFSQEPVVYEAENIYEAATMLEEDIQAAFGWRPNVEPIYDFAAVRWHYGEGGSRVFDGQEGFDRSVWLRNPNWEPVLVEED